MRLFAAFSLGLAVAAIPAAAQSTFATLTGSVTDPSGAAVPAAKVEAVKIETNFRYETTSNEDGQYTIANIPDGTYRLRVVAPGFQEFKVSGIILTGRDTRRVDASLTLGSTGTVVEVQGGATLIETETARIADTKDREVLRALPLTLRRAWDYFTMTPTVERTSSWHISISGTRNNQSIAAIDGTPINDAGGGTGIGPLMDKTESLQELRIDMAQGSAESMTAGQVTLISRAGSNDFRGALSDYYSTDAFRARDPFQNTRSTGRNHIFTASAGGPIYIPRIYDGRNRSFFFFTLESSFGSRGITRFVNGVPLEAWRRGDFSRAGVNLVDPFAGQAPFPGNVIPASRLNATARGIQEEFFPLPNFGDPNIFTNSNFRLQRPAFRHWQPTFTTRIDQKLSDKVFVYGRWTAVRWNIPNYDTAVPTVDRLFTRRRDMDAITGAYTHTLSAALTNEFRYGFTRQDFPQEAAVNGNQMVQRYGLRGLAPNLPDVGGLHRVSFAGVGITPLGVTDACSPCGRNRIHNFTDNLSWFRGAHSFKLGYFAAWSQSAERRQNPNLFGFTEYTNRFSGHPYSDFLLGIPSTMRRAFPAVLRDNTRWDHSLYITDEWKVRPALTVTLGVRWDVHTPWKEAAGQMAIFDIDSSRLVVPDGSAHRVSPFLPRSYADVVEASAVGRPSSLVRTDWNNFAPRIGVAWRPLGNSTVFRGGFGIYYDTAPWQPTSAGVPFVLNEPDFTNLLENPLLLPNVFPTAGSGVVSSFSLPNGIRPDLRIPFTMQYNLTIEHQRWNTGFRLTYTGTNTRQGIWRYDINQPRADAQLYVDKPRRFPRYPDILYADNGAGHQYHGMTFEVERRMRGGVHLQSYFVWARDIGDLERGQAPEDAFDRRRERAVWERFGPRRLSGNVIYELPFGRGRKFGNTSHWLANGVLGGWNLSTIVALEAGRFITPQWRGADPTGTRFTTGRNRPIVTLRPDHLRDANAIRSTIDRWFDPTAFAPPAIGAFGSAAKGTIIGTPTQVLHASIAKHFLIRERLRLRLEMLATNATNTPNYQDPDVRIDQVGAAGRVTAVINRNLKFDSAIPRELQTQIRLEW